MRIKPSLYKSYFMSCLQEDNTAGSGGVFGDYSDAPYADGDARIPVGIGTKKIKRRKKNKIDMSVSQAFPHIHTR